MAQSEAQEVGPTAKWTEADYVAASERADDLVDGGGKEQGLALLQQAEDHARASGEDAFALFFEGELANYRGDYLGQLELQLRADHGKPETPLILRNVGVALGSLGRSEEALTWFDRALALQPNDHLAWRNRGVCLSRLERHEEALQSLERALAICPDEPRVRDRMGAVLGRMGRYAEAARSFDQVLAVLPDYRAALRSRAVVRGLMGKAKEAAAELRALLASDPSDEQARIWLTRFARNREARATVAELEELRRKRHMEQFRAEKVARDQRLKFDAWRTLSARSAHRIGNQLFASIGALRTLKGLTGAGAEEAVSDLEGCVERIRQIVREFQRFSTNEAPRLARMQIGPLVEEVVRRYERVVQNVALCAEVAEGLPDCLLDRSQFDQAVGELLENAMHHTPQGGRIRVAATPIPPPAGPRVRITVEDTGPGVPENAKRHLFEAFFTTRPGGTGLGLAIVKQIVDNHGGTVRETGKAGEGARFEIELPAAPDEESRP